MQGKKSLLIYARSIADLFFVLSARQRTVVVVVVEAATLEIFRNNVKHNPAEVAEKRRHSPTSAPHSRQISTDNDFHE